MKVSKYIGITAEQARQIAALARKHEEQRAELQERQRVEMQQLEEAQGRGMGVANELSRIAGPTNPSSAT